MSYNLFLDDVRDPKSLGTTLAWVVVRDYDQFVATIEQMGLPSIVSFDHDLAEEHYRPSMYESDGHYSKYYHDGTFKEKTGYHCALWLIEYCKKHNLPLPHWNIHSMNPVGRTNIALVLTRAESYLSEEE